jgi:hypothetical protein
MRGWPASVLSTGPEGNRIGAELNEMCTPTFSVDSTRMDRQLPVEHEGREKGTDVREGDG